MTSVELTPSLRPAALGLLLIFLCHAAAGADDTTALLRRAQELDKAGQAQQAIALYRDVLRADPQSADAGLGLGRDLYVAGQYAEAMANLEHALKLRPGDPTITNWLGRSYLRQNQPEKVLELTKGAAVGSDSASLHLLAARAYDALDNLGAARQEIDRALQLNAHCPFAHFALGFLAWGDGDLAAADKGFQFELTRDPHQVVSAYYLSESLCKQDKLDEAESVLTRAAQGGAGAYLLHFGLGKVHERQKDYAAAIAQYREAIRIDSTQSDAHSRLAMLLRARGEREEANLQFQAFRETQMAMDAGMGQGMGRMRPRLPDLDFGGAE